MSKTSRTENHSIRQIENGYLTTTSSSDSKGNYSEKVVYSRERPRIVVKAESKGRGVASPTNKLQGATTKR